MLATLSPTRLFPMSARYRASELLAGSDGWPNKSKLKFTVRLLQHAFCVCRQFKTLVWPVHHGAFLFPWRSCVKDELVLYVCVGVRTHVFMCSFVNIGVEKGVNSKRGRRRQSMHLSLDILLI
jgi:hypothetical protein